MEHIIVGNGIAAVSAAEVLRRLDPSCSITMVSHEDAPPYSRPLLHKCLAGDLKEEETYIRQKDFYAQHRITIHMGSRVTTVHPNRNAISLSDGRLLRYDTLLLALGASPIRPKIDGISLPGVLPFRTLSDCKKIDYEAKKAKRAVVVGGGLVGMLAAIALMGRGLKVTIVEKMHHVLPKQLDITSAQLFQSKLREVGGAVITGVGIKEVVKRTFGSEIKEVLLEDGRAIPAQMVVVAIGVMPNVDLAKNAGLEVKRGIVVNEMMQSSSERIFAAGDVAEPQELTQGEKTWERAAEQGRFAAYNMVGQTRKHQGFFGLFLEEFFSIPFTSMGPLEPEEGDYHNLCLNQLESSLYKKVIFKDDLMVGMVLLGDVDQAAAFATLIRKGVRLGAVKERLLDPHFDLWAFLKEKSLEPWDYKADYQMIQ